MATAVTFNPNNDDYPIEFELRETGEFARRTFRVDSQDFVEIVAASGLPRRGDQFSADFPALLCRRVIIREWIGSTHVKVECEYETQGAGGVIGGRGRDWTEMVSQPVAIQVFGSVDPGDPNRVGGGQGATKELYEVNFRVHAFLTESEFNTAYRNRLVGLHAGFTNNAPIQLPRLQGSGSSFTLARGQARYLGPQFQGVYEQGVVEVVHGIAARENHLAFWREEEPDGGVGIERSAVIYDEQDLSGLWSLV